MNNKILSVRTSDLLSDALRYMKIKCNIDDESKEGARMYQGCMGIWSKYFAGSQIDILINRFGSEFIDKKQQCLKIGTESFTCHLLKVIDAESVTGGYLYLFHAPQVDMTSMEQTGRFYTECWQIALVDAARIWLERYLRRQQPEGENLSESFGPGFYGMEIEAVSAVVNQMQAEQVGVRLLDNGMMEPAISLVGMFLAGAKSFDMPSGDCVSCLGTSHCRMCRHYIEKD